MPYVQTCLLYTSEKKEIYLLEENLGKPENKENNTPKLSQKVRDKHLQNQHIGGIIITGDPVSYTHLSCISMGNIQCHEEYLWCTVLPGTVSTDCP